MSAAEKTEVVIIGAGAAGLAAGACLKRAGIPFIILERSDRIGSAWHQHYDRLHLHTDKGHSALPYLPFPKSVPKYPSRQQVIDYLENYAKHFALEPRFNQEVISTKQENGTWITETRTHSFLSNDLIVATGYASQPVRPSWPGLENFSGELLHSSEYKNGIKFEGKNVLVVGFGNSGGEIAIDLVEHGARVALSVRSPVNVIPRDVLGIPVLALGIAMSWLPTPLADALSRPLRQVTIGDLSKFGLRKLPYGPMTQIRRDSRIPLLDIGTIDLIKRGRINVRPGITAFEPAAVRFTDGTTEPYDTVILATGYRPNVETFLQSVDGAVDARGQPTTSGREAPVPGLYFCGFYVSPTGMLREIGIEAKNIANHILNNKK